MKTNPTEAEAGSVEAAEKAILETAWDCIEHGLRYEGVRSGPAILRRAAHQIAALRSPVLAEPEAQKASEEPTIGSIMASDTHRDAPKNVAETRWAVNDQHQITRDGKPIKFKPASEEKEAVSESVEAVLQKTLNLLLRYGGWVRKFDCNGHEIAMTRPEDVQEIVKECAVILSSHSNALIAPPVTPNPASPSTAAGERAGVTQ